MIATEIGRKIGSGGRRRRIHLWLAAAALVAALPLVADAERGRHVSRRPPRNGAPMGSAPDHAPAPLPVAPPQTATPPGSGEDAAGFDPALAAPEDVEGAEGDSAGEPEIVTVGEQGMEAYFVDHAGPWSLHAEMLPTEYLFRLWQEIGGPEVVSRTPIDRAFTISVHRERTERILERILDGYGYTLHYDGDGRLELVRVYSPAPNAGEFKTPRLVESLSAWRDVEFAPADSSSAQSN